MDSPVTWRQLLIIVLVIIAIIIMIGRPPHDNNYSYD